ncbi:MAG: RNA pseudouridine synthase [Pseudomonadales bacterium]|nr:RNA pseudouridine synthase [Pseudomonadales bacterium]
MNKDKPLQITVDITEDGLLPVNVLAEASGLSKSQVKDAMVKGAVWVSKKLAVVKAKPKPSPVVNLSVEADDSQEPDYYGVRARAAQAAASADEAAASSELLVTESPVIEAVEANIGDAQDESHDGDEVIDVLESGTQDVEVDPRFSKPRRLRRIKSKLKLGDQLTLNYDQAVLAGGCADAVLVADEGSYSVWYKPAGMLCQGSRWGDHTTLYRWAEKHLVPERTAFIVHRIDRMASGLVVLAHSKKAAVDIANQFASRKVEKSYRVIVAGDPALTLPHTIDTDIDGKPARTTINEKRILQELDSPLANMSDLVSELSVSIETGKKHQIRRHLASLGYPILGDRLYGGDASGLTQLNIDSEAISDSGNDNYKDNDIDLQLVAVKIAFTAPGTETYHYYGLPDSVEDNLTTV